jgi:hypothetical protein
MMYADLMEAGVGLMDNSITEWVRRHPDHVYDQPEIEHMQVDDGVHHGRVWLSADFFIFVFGDSWEEVDRKGKLRWSKICGRPVGL